MNKQLQYKFSAEKNSQLKNGIRNISFEEIISAIHNNKVLDVIDHPNQRTYKNQKMYIVEYNNYVYVVPFSIENEEEVFLKTIIPNRKMKKVYLHK